MRRHHRTVPISGAIAGATIAAALAWAAPAPADPADPVTPTTIAPVPAPPNPMTPNQPVVPAGDPVAAPAPASPFQPYVPPVQNQTYGSGNNGGGVFGTLMDLWDQVKNPTLDGSADTGRPTPPPGAGPAPALPPGYVSINAPGSETASTTPAGGPATGRPALPPGYYSIDGPPPPGYQYGKPAAPVTTVPVMPPAS
ncbi:MAG TPA: hypothetical protein PLH92_05420 [Mycobacterium sp.]|uniref:hypothetical protein n=1 Tax=Mycolicibacterium sp. TaxID=2320850 RepID=UPI0025E1328B|nr:hypothetical protein [Mycolicibacterium sp.]HPX35909.1 hypothetical protein [Mycobacterium sp.]HQC76141.1 hypothetical protein [Mycobacterium sp.]